MQTVRYVTDELILYLKEYKDAASSGDGEKKDRVRHDIARCIIELVGEKPTRFNSDGSAFFAGELDGNLGEKERERPKLPSVADHSVELYKERRDKRAGIKRSASASVNADDEEEGAGDRGAERGHGNTKLPFGLCRREGIEVGKDWSPRDAWEALMKKGYNVGDVYRELRETGKVAPRKATWERPAAQAKTIQRIAKRTAHLKNEQYRIVDRDGNILVEHRGDQHSVASTAGEKREYLSGNISIHNHPAGGTFSADDLRDFGFGAREIVVATADGEYSLVNTKFGTKEQYVGWHAMQEAYRKACPNNVSSYDILKKARKNLENCEELRQMHAISEEFVRRKDAGESLKALREWSGMTQYTALEAAYKKKLQKEQRRLEVAPNERFIKENAEKYGFLYTFTPAKKRRGDSTDEEIKKREAAIRAFRERRRHRLDSSADGNDEEGRWVTTENDHKVHINEEGVPDKGNPHVLAAMSKRSFKTEAEAKDFLKKNLGFTSINVEGVDLSVLQTIADTVQDIQKRYPELKAVQEIMVSDGKGGAVSSMSPATVGKDGKLTGFRLNLYSALQGTTKEEFESRGDHKIFANESLQGFIWHEFGHAYANYMDYKMALNSMGKALGDPLTDQEQLAVYHFILGKKGENKCPWIKQAFQKAKKSFEKSSGGKLYTSNISRYAAKSYDEMFAEAFSDFHASKNPKPESIAIMRGAGIGGQDAA